MPKSRVGTRIASLAMLLAAFLARPHAAQAAVSHPTITVSGGSVAFYSGHVILDARGNVTLTDGLLSVRADRVMLDMRAQRYVAFGNVSVSGTTQVSGDAVAVDLKSRRGLVVAAAVQPATQYIDGGTISTAAPPAEPDGTSALGDEPLKLPDVGYEQPFAVASRAVAHIDADVRLAHAKVLVPGGAAVPLPSYVYTFSPYTGYVVTNINSGGEDVPIYFGSTPNSIQGLHLSYNPVTKVAVGLDDHIVDGNRAYNLISASPLFGPTKTVNFTWQQQISDRATQTFNSSTTTGVGTFDNYDIRDSLHRSFLELSANQFRGNHGGTIAWQSFTQSIGPEATSKAYFFLRSEYGYTHVPLQGSFAPFPATISLPNSVFHKTLEGFLGSQPLILSSSSSLGLSADLRQETDTLPHRQLSQIYNLRFDQRLTPNFATTLSGSEAPVFDSYPSVSTGFHSLVSTQSLALDYFHSGDFALQLGINHGSVRSDNPSPPFVYPWFVTADVRFRVTQSLSLDISRAYFFGYSGQRFGPLGFQILP